ncbi:MAG: (2Fe-2S)-binding protein [Synergistales bacterium]|nr:(2Fe-2S)-binding protein [Synergistales bacterium]
MSWLEKGAHETVCYCKNVSKMQILSAITIEGAKNLDDIKRITGACTGGECKVKNPSGKCCSGDIQEILDLYLPIWSDMREGAEDCSGDCSSCGGCGQQL